MNINTTRYYDTELGGWGIPDEVRMAKEYAERVCSGQFPITYTREQVVAHTENDYKSGWNEANKVCKEFWYNSGLMAERILASEEISRLKEEVEWLTRKKQTIFDVLSNVAKRRMDRIKELKADNERLRGVIEAQKGVLDIFTKK